MLLRMPLRGKRRSVVVSSNGRSACSLASVLPVYHYCSGNLRLAGWSSRFSVPEDSLKAELELADPSRDD